MSIPPNFSQYSALQTILTDLEIVAARTLIVSWAPTVDSEYDPAAFTNIINYANDFNFNTLPWTNNTVHFFNQPTEPPGQLPPPDVIIPAPGFSINTAFASAWPDLLTMWRSQVAIPFTTPYQYMMLYVKSGGGFAPSTVISGCTSPVLNTPSLIDIPLPPAPAYIYPSDFGTAFYSFAMVGGFYPGGNPPSQPWPSFPDLVTWAAFVAGAYGPDWNPAGVCSVPTVPPYG